MTTGSDGQNPNPNDGAWNNPLLNNTQPQREGYLTSPVGSSPVNPLPTSPNSSPTTTGGHIVPNEVDDEAKTLPLSSLTQSTTATPVDKAKNKSESAKDPKNAIAGVIDTLEAVIIALILALTFRAYVVEAFVIPTCSMAPTLMGAHFDIRCPKCGYEFKENASLRLQFAPISGVENGGVLQDKGQRAELTDSTVLPTPDNRVCPNCGYAINAQSFPGNPLPRKIPIAQDKMEEKFFPWANNGDRILVQKYLYSILEPQRWDVIVFKEPVQRQDNYIKRLVGLPGDTLEIVGGDLFIKPASKPGEPEKPMSIARKPLVVQDAAWLNVYDNDFYPTDADEHRESSVGVDFTSPWHAVGLTANKWNTRSSVVEYLGTTSGKLQFEPGKLGWLLYNVRGYNNDLMEADKDGVVHPAQGLYHVPVADLRLETLWHPGSASEGEVKLVMAVGPESFKFKVIWDSKGLALQQWDPVRNSYREVKEAKPIVDLRPEAGKWYQVGFNNVDHQVQFFIDGKLVLEYQPVWLEQDAVAWAEKRMEHPELAQLEIEVGGPSKLAHIKVKRDIYYTNNSIGMSNILNNYQWTFGSLSQGIQGRPVTLGADEFFVLGDNSTASFDSRGWSSVDPSLDDLPVGREKHKGIVPRRFLLGRAFFVYWPAGFRPMNGAYKALDMLDKPLVPNVGEMRFIH